MPVQQQLFRSSRIAIYTMPSMPRMQPSMPRIQYPVVKYALLVQGAVLTVIAQQRLVHILEDVRAGNIPSGKHRGSEQDLQQMAEVAK